MFSSRGMGHHMPTSSTYEMNGELGPRSGLLRSILESSAGPWQVHGPLLRSAMTLHATLHWRFPSCTDIVSLPSAAQAPQSGRCYFIHHYGKSPLQSLGRYSQSGWPVPCLPSFVLKPQLYPWLPNLAPCALPARFPCSLSLLLWPLSRSPLQVLMPLGPSFSGPPREDLSS